jgi:hypothetical protein
MANLRVIWDNAIDRATSLAASTTAGALAASNMQNDFKGQVHRSTGTSVTYTATWSAGEVIGGVVLPMTNLSSAATIRVRRYADTACTNLIDDSGTVYACPGLTLGMWNWSQPLDANAFPYAGFSKSSVWMTPQTVYGLVVDLVDTSNAAGYIDCARLIAGNYWESSKNPSYGAKMSVSDTSKSARNDAGDLLSDLGVKYETLNVNLALLSTSDRAYLLRILRSAGTGRNILASVYPDSGNSTLEQDHTIYGKRSNSDISTDFYNQYSNTLQMESW